MGGGLTGRRGRTRSKRRGCPSLRKRYGCGAMKLGGRERVRECGEVGRGYLTWAQGRRASGLFGASFQDEDMREAGDTEERGTAHLFGTWDYAAQGQGEELEQSPEG